jgi:hypothetical protein
MRSIVAALSLLVALPVYAESAFSPLPAEQTGGRVTGLELRVVSYDGSVNGALTIDVRNPTQKPVEFSAHGLYFVPDGNADGAPQRLGAVGSFQMQNGQSWERREKAVIASGATVRMRLDVYCIDSHRGSPSSSTAFHPATTRVPKALAEKIDYDTKEASKKLGGQAAPAAKSAVQSEVWKDRDLHWIQLDGEGKQEAGKKR